MMARGMQRGFAATPSPRIVKRPQSRGVVVPRTSRASRKAFEDRIESPERDLLFALEQAEKKPTPTHPFAETFERSLRFLANPYECWKIGSEEARALAPKLAFAAPLQYTRETGCLNSEKSSVFSMLEGESMSRKKVVPPA